MRVRPCLVVVTTILGVAVSVSSWGLGDLAAAESPSVQPGASAEGEQSLPLQFTDIQRLPNAVSLAKLSNGLTVIVQENHVAPVATVRCFVRNTGSAYEGKWVGAGLSHVLEHVVAGGSTTHRDEKEIEQIIDTFGGATNAFTSTDMTVYFIDSPAQNAMTALGLLADQMQSCKFDPAEFERELKVVRRELADGEVDRQRVLHRMLNQTLYTLHPARHPVIGYLDVLNRTTNQTIIDFYRDRYIPNNQVVVVVGDVDTHQVFDEVAKLWSSTRRNYETQVAFPEEPEQLTPREATREMDGSTYDMAFAWPTVTLSHPDLYALDLAAYILAEGESSRLVQSLKYERPLVLGIQSASYTPEFVRGWFGVLAASTPEHWKEAAEAIQQGVYRLREELVNEAELAKAKKQKSAELVFQSQTVQQSADQLGRNYLSARDPLFDQRYVAGIQQVTAEQIRDVARRYFTPDRLNRVVIAPPGGAPQRAEEKAAAAETPVRLERLPNGLRVLVKRHAQLPMVNIQAFVLGGSLVDTPATAGRSSLVAAMLDKGAGSHSARDIADYFDGVGGQFAVSAGRNTIYASASVLREDFPQALQVFAECFTRPTFPEEEFAKVQKLALGAIARRADSPHAEVMELFADALPAGTPYHLVEGGKKETVSKLTVADVRRYHQQYFVPANMVVTVFGDVDPDAALRLVAQRFGSLKPNAETPAVGFDRDNHLDQDVVRHKQIGKQTAMVMLGYPAVSIRDPKEYAALTLLDAISSGYSYPGGWLHNELRGEGLVYFVHASILTGPAPGYFMVLAQTRPDKIDEVLQRIQRNLDRAKAGQITPEEFQVARQMIVALHAQENTTVGQQARQAALDELYGLGYDYDKHFDQRIQAVTLEEVVGVAKRVLNQRRVQVTTSPEAR